MLALLHLLGLIWTFYALCILCDEHLVPAVDVFIKQFEVPEEVAGKLSNPFAAGLAIPHLLFPVIPPRLPFTCSPFSSMKRTRLQNTNFAPSF